MTKKRKTTKASASPKVIVSKPAKAKKPAVEERLKNIAKEMLNPKDGAVDPELMKAVKRVNG